MNNQKKKELIEEMVAVLKDAADNPREGVSSICCLGVGMMSTFYFSDWWKGLFGRRDV